jgi:hypothetical protein
VPNKSGYLRFLDNCAILTVEKCFIEEEEIVGSLQKLFDHSW